MIPAERGQTPRSAQIRPRETDHWTCTTSTARRSTGEARIFLRRAGSGPPVLLLRGFPQTHEM